MKTAEEWTQLYFNATAEEMGGNVFASHIKHVNLIRADALREAAEIVGTTSFSRTDIEYSRQRVVIRDAILAKAKELEK